MSDYRLIVENTEDKKRFTMKRSEATRLRCEHIFQMKKCAEAREALEIAESFPTRGPIIWLLTVALRWTVRKRLEMEEAAHKGARITYLVTIVDD